jgi:hypothetical protein
MRVIVPRPPWPLLDADALDCWLAAGAALVLCRPEELAFRALVLRPPEELPRLLRLPDARALPLPLLRELALRLLPLLRVPALLRALPLPLLPFPLLRLLPLLRELALRPLPLLRVLPLLDALAS